MGGYSVVDAVVALSEFAIKSFPNANHFCLLSGADFPMKTHGYIRDYLATMPEMDFIQGTLLPSEKTGWLEGGRRRIEAYVLPLNAHSNATIEPRKLSFGNMRQFAKVLLTNARKLPKALMMFLTYPKRVVPFGIKIYAGEMWWMLTKATLAKVLEWDESNPCYHKYHEDSQVPDEMYFNTLVWNLSKSVNPDIKRFISWDSKQGSSPRWMDYKTDKQLIDKLIDNSNILFARKIKESQLVDYVIGILAKNNQNNLVLM